MKKPCKRFMNISLHHSLRLQKLFISFNKTYKPFLRYGIARNPFQPTQCIAGLLGSGGNKKGILGG